MERTDQPTPQPSPFAEPWPEGVIARYLTIAGATIDLRRPSNDSGALHGECGGCDDYFGANADSIVKPRAQAHAERCRALPRPTATA
ncbi:hypothetical protein ACH40E_02975 [Streptomyces acidicola]|uniref:hypothetical protein n=1 Tax=Streptomyces acidicola TaxID=2596892 RepID=UPI0037942B5B